MRRLAPVLAAVVAAAAVFLAWPSEDRAPAPAAPKPDAGRAVFAKLGCGSCHQLAAAGSTGEFAPNLDERLRHHTASSLRATILDPPGRYSMMPGDFGERTTDAELDALVAFLLKQPD